MAWDLPFPDSCASLPQYERCHWPRRDQCAEASPVRDRRAVDSLAVGGHESLLVLVRA